MKKQYIQMVATVSDHLLHIQTLHPRQGTAPDPAVAAELGLSKSQKLLRRTSKWVPTFLITSSNDPGIRIHGIKFNMNDN
jgi:hypothetical protein